MFHDHMSLITDARAVVFDCDGVVLDSNRVKSEAFLSVVDSDPEPARAAFLAYHEAHGGVSRHAKFAHYYQNILGQQEWQAPAAAAAERYGAIVRERLRSCAPVPGVDRFLARLAEKNIPCFMISAGSAEETVGALEGRGLLGYFREILDNRRTKTEHLDYLELRRHGLMPATFFGDSEADRQAAAIAGLQFVFVFGYTLWTAGTRLCQEAGIPVVRDFTSL